MQSALSLYQTRSLLELHISLLCCRDGFQRRAAGSAKDGSKQAQPAACLHHVGTFPHDEATADLPAAGEEPEPATGKMAELPAVVPAAESGKG